LSILINAYFQRSFACWLSRLKTVLKCGFTEHLRMFSCERIIGQIEIAGVVPILPHSPACWLGWLRLKMSL
jgi:hypothetical protein